MAFALFFNANMYKSFYLQSSVNFFFFLSDCKIQLMPELHTVYAWRKTGAAVIHKWNKMFMHHDPINNRYNTPISIERKFCLMGAE